MKERYSRQILFQPIGEQGQLKLASASIAIIGCGALGTAIAETLVRAGVGTVHLADRDYVEMSNLQRQQLFTNQHAKEQIPKVIAAKQQLQAIDPDCTIHTYLQHVDGPFASQLAKRVDLFLDATDNFETRLVINDVSYKYGIPWIHGACVRSGGVIFPFIPNRTACFRCLLPVLPGLNETCDTVGIIAPAVQITAARQSAEALKILTHQFDMVSNKIHYFDCWDNETMNIGINKIKNSACQTCGNDPIYPELQMNHEQRYSILCGRNTVQVLPGKNRTITLDDAEAAAKRINGLINRTEYFVQLTKEHYRILVFYDGRLLIHGLKDIQKGRQIFVDLFG